MSPRAELAEDLREDPVMDRRTFLAGTGAVLLSAPLAVEAQPAGKVPRVGFLTAFARSDVPQWHEGFRQGLRDFGYTEGRNIVIEYRYAEGRPVSSRPRLRRRVWPSNMQPPRFPS